MTSERMIASNRHNGRRGRGPRTAAGKATSSRNALRHGLAVSLLDEPAICAKVETLARAIVGDGAGAAQLSLATAVAEAQLELERIKAAKLRMMNSHLEASAPERTPRRGEVIWNLQSDEAAPGNDDPSTAKSTEGLAGPPSIELLQGLLRLERYELRAISRRRRAMRAFFCATTTANVTA